MPVLERRVTTLEDVLERFIEHTETMMADLAAGNARTDRKLLEMQQRADRDWVRAEQDRERDRETAEKGRERADQERDRDREKAEKDREDFNRRMAEDRERWERKWEKAEKERKDFNRRLAEVTDSQGLMIENMVWPNLSRIASEVFGDEHAVTCGIRLKRRHRGERGWNMEIDLLAASASKVLVCEAKSKVDASKAAEFLEKLKSFRDYFPEYAGHQILPMIASIAFDDSVLRHLSALGIYALGFGDETMELLNADTIRELHQAQPA